MIARITIDGIEYHTDLSSGRSIAIPVNFSGPQPNSYDVPPARARAYEVGSFVGDTRSGGSCNFDTVTITPHCNGTHTECVGHIAIDRISIDDILVPAMIPATLLSVGVEDAIHSNDHYEPAMDIGDRLITAAALRTALANAADAKVHPTAFHQAFVLRTLPNDGSKTVRNYMAQPAPYFSIEAMQLLRDLDVTHLLVDIPSLDRAFDQGRMAAHHIFWDVEAGSHDVPRASASRRSVTEMIYVPDDIPDGRYLIDIQIAPFAADAAPSRPVLYAVTQTSSSI
ncbi:MAG: cyclase family protein [Bacteroidetes bacterium]|nr:cyclase family protein [Bacteroidota bacterium]